MLLFRNSADAGYGCCPEGREDGRSDLIPRFGFEYPMQGELTRLNFASC